jgi:hypothetical protein
MMPPQLDLMDTPTAILSLSGLTIDQWVNQYVESGRAARDYDRLLEAQRKAWLSELRALDSARREMDLRDGN